MADTSIYDTSEIAPLLNVHMLQTIPTEDDAPCTPRPLLLSAYAVDNRITAINVLNRWMYIFQHCLEKNVRIIGFSTDADRRYVSATRLASVFFSSLSDLQLDKHQHAFRIDLSKHWTWSFLRSSQLFLFFQDPVHLVTKWRNRLLSSTTDLHFGFDKINISHIKALINDSHYTKLDHGLTSSDINPKDRQNYNSCIKIISDDVINLLINSEDTNGTVDYLTLLKMIVKAYIDKAASISELHHKHKQDDPLIYTDRLDEISTLNVEQIILGAHNQAINIVKHSKMLHILNQNNIVNLKDLSDFVFDCLKRSSKMYGYSSQTTIDNNEELESDDDDDDEDEDVESDVK
ncbi:unnamed protein product [Rotaria socialis]